MSIHGATVVDPESQTVTARDVAWRGGNLSEADGDADHVIDGSGLFVAPGLIDLHAHVFPRASLGVTADRVGYRQGVTTLVDAGTSGSRDFDAFIAEVVEPSRTRVLSWLNIASSGLVDNSHELVDMANVDEAATAATIQSHPDVVRGIKVRMSGSVIGNNGTRPLEAARRVADSTGVRIMIHTGNRPPDMGDSLDLLRSGDVCSHAFHGKVGGLFDGGEQMIRAASAALERGVLFDVGHGEASFAFDTLEHCQRLGVLPYSVSTDIHIRNIDGPVFSQAVTMSKLLASGITLLDVVTMATAHPAAILGRPELGSLALGTPADLTVFELVGGGHDFVDAEGVHRRGEHVIVPKFCVIAGEVFDCD